MSKMTIAQAAAHYGVSTKTVRRWIQAKRIEAEKIQGRWYVHAAEDTLDTDAQADAHPPNATATMSQMQSEIDHLREVLANRDKQIEQLSHLLAMQTKQTQQVINQLPAPRPSLAERIGRLFPLFRAKRA